MVQIVARNLYNNHPDNYDKLRFGNTAPIEKKTIRSQIRRGLNGKGYYNKLDILPLENLSQHLWVNNFEYLYYLLEDETSRKLLLDIIAYRLLGYKKVKLSLNTPEYWKQIQLIQLHENKEDYIQIKFMNFKLYYNDLDYLNLPIKLYFATAGIHVDFIIKQYELKRSNVYIAAKAGDVVIDGGGCFGDTALYFAHLSAEIDAVHSFEFIPDNIEVWKKNIQLNPKLGPFISLVKSPLWSSSDVDLYFKANGPGSTVSFESFDGYDGIAKTVTIDDYVRQRELKKVDFIKLDIEGAELNALKGATDTLRNFRPKLAVALYHSPEDFNSIPKFIKELELGYRFYLSHATIHAEETMLFAISSQND